MKRKAIILLICFILPYLLIYNIDAGDMTFKQQKIEDAADTDIASQSSADILIWDGDTWNDQTMGTDATIDASGNLTISGDAVALSTDTTGNYVLDVADGTGIDGTAAGEGATYTPTLDLTEINTATFGSGTFTTLTFDAGATDPVFTFGSNSFGITSGNVGIGTTNPNAEFVVAGGGAEIVAAEANQNYFVELYGDNNPGLFYKGVGGLRIGTVSGLGGSGFSEKVRIDNSGNVGIGTTAPGARLHIGNGDQSPSGIMSTTGGLFIENAGTSNTASALQIKTGGGLGLVVQNSGNVGIGTTVPTSTLHVVPTRASGDYAYLVDVSDGGGSGSGAMSGGASQKTYVYNTIVNRPSASAATGDSNDALYKGIYKNWADNDASFIARGLNLSVRNEDSGEIGMLIGGSIGANNKVTATSAGTIKGLEVTAESYAPVSNEFGGIDIVLKNEHLVATTEYGLRVRNLNNSVADAVGSAILISDAGVNTGYDYGIDMNGASVVTAALRFPDGTTQTTAPTGGGSVTTVEDGDVQVGGADIVTLDFDGTDFAVTEAPNTEANIAIVNDGHLHTTTSVSGLDISADTNLAVTAPVVLTDDTLSLTVAKDIVAGVGLSGGENNVLVGADADTTLTFDATEIDALTWSDSGQASIAHTFSNTGTDVVMTYSTGALAVTGNISATNLSGSNTGDDADTSTTNEINTITCPDANATAGLGITFAQSGTMAITEAADTITFTVTEAQTLDNVSDLGATTDQALTTGGIVVGDGDTVGAATNKWLFDDTGGDISCSGNVGIGTTAPENKLHIWKATSGAADTHAQALLTLENDTEAYIQFHTPNTTTAGLLFGDPENDVIGQLTYTHSTNLFNFKTAGSDRMVIDGTGNVGIGTTAPAQLLDMVASSAIGFAGTAILSDSAGTMTLSDVDALGATTETTVEAAIDTLANLTSVQSLTIGLADAGADAFWGWDDTATTYENLTDAEAMAVIGGAATDLDANGAVAWGNITAGELADNTVDLDDFVHEDWGEVTNASGSVVIDDSVAVASWNLTTPTITTSLTTSTPTTLSAAELDRLDGLAGIIVTDATACTDLEGTNLSITAGVLNAAGGGGESLAATLAIGADANDVDTTSWGKMEGFDAGLYLDWDADGVIDLTSDGTLELHSNDWDIDATGAISNCSLAAATNVIEADTVTNATLTTALTVDTGTVGLTGNVANTSVLTLGAGASSISGANTGDNTVATSGDSATSFFASGEIADAQISDTLTASTCTGNAATATALQNARTINGVSFNGTANITVTADANTLSNTTLKSTVLASSLTSLGTIGSLVATTADINGGTLDGVQIGATTATGELIVNNVSDDADGLGSQGTSGQVLTSAGAGANPTWATPGGGSLILVGSASPSAATTADITGLDGDTDGIYYVVFDLSFTTTGATPRIELQINNSGALTYDQNVGNILATSSATTIQNTGQTTGSTFKIIQTASSTTYLKGHLWIGAETVSTSQGITISGQQFISHNTPGGGAMQTIIGWCNMGTNITSLDFTVGNASGTPSMTGTISVYKFTLT